MKIFSFTWVVFYFCLFFVGHGYAAISKVKWVKVKTTEYYPAPEKWFKGAAVKTPGLKRKSRVDWLYSSSGMAMEGDGIGTDGKRYHIQFYGSKWLSKEGKPAFFGSGELFWVNSPVWLNKKKQVTFPLLNGEWFNGKASKFVNNPKMKFSEGPSMSLTYLRSVASDRSLISKGSLIYLPSYHNSKVKSSGWMRADDAGSAVKGYHVDVYTKPPAYKDKGGRFQTKAKMFVVPKGKIKWFVKNQKKYDLPPLPRIFL